MPENPSEDVLSINLTSDGHVQIQGNIRLLCETLKANAASVFEFIGAMKELDDRASDRVTILRSQLDEKNNCVLELAELQRKHIDQSQELDIARNKIQELEHRARG